jgi:hypothetical protein
VINFMLLLLRVVLHVPVRRLPVVVSAGSRPGLAALLARIKEHLTRILQLQQPAQQQQHPQQQHAPAWLGAAGEPASKKQRTAEAAAAAAGADTQITELLDALLSAYAAASASPPAAATDGSWDWRVELLGVLQELPLLHGPLLQRLLGSLCGSAWPQEVAPQQVRGREQQRSYCSSPSRFLLHALTGRPVYT